MQASGTRDSIAMAIKTVLPLAYRVDFVEERADAAVLILITCLPLTDEEKPALREAIVKVMPATIAWSLVTFDGVYDTPEHRAQAETVWRLGDLEALMTLVEAWGA